MRIFDGIVDCCYIISMEKHVSKFIKTKRDVENKFSGPIYRTLGIDGDYLDISMSTKAVNPHYLKCLHPRVIGCAWSHVRTWSDFYLSGKESCMILEDDVIWSKSIDKQAIRDLGKVKEKADIIYVGSFGLNRPREEYGIDDQLIRLVLYFSDIQVKSVNLCSEHWIVPQFPTGLYGYILTRQGCRTLLSLLQQDGIIQHIDIQLNYYHNQLVMVAAKKPWLENNYQTSELSSSCPRLLNTATQHICFSDQSPVSWRLSHDVYGHQGWFFVLGAIILYGGWPVYIISILLYLGKSSQNSPSWKNILYYFTSVLIVREIVLHLWIRQK